MKIVINYKTIASLVLIIWSGSSSCCFNYPGLKKHQIPYIAQALYIMRGKISQSHHQGMSAKNSTSEALRANTSVQADQKKILSSPQSQTVIHLTQKDFESGTYRIRTPNTTIILDTDIEFEPTPAAEATRTDKPFIGWFAAITVETDNVIIDLKGKTIQASEIFLANDIENAFADIELDNAPFAGFLFGVLGAFFPGDTEFVSANNVIIQNGTLGRSDHWCIHGNNNSNITIRDMHLKDFEVTAIELNGVIDSQIHDIKITKLEHVIRTNFVGVAASTLISYLTILANTPAEDVPPVCQELLAEACQQLAALLAYVNANPVIFNTPLLVPQGEMSGMQFASGFLNFTFFPATPANCEFAASLSQGRTVENLTVENVSIDGIKNAPQESVLIASQADGTIFNMPLYGVPVFGALTWDSAFDAQGNFAPSPLLLAQIYVINVQLCLFPDVIVPILPPNYLAIADSILTGNEAEFLANTFPVFGIALDSVQLKGSFGVRFDCSQHCLMKNCTVRNVHNVGKPGQTLSDIPAGSYYEGLVIPTQYIGNDSWGFEFGTQVDGLVENCTACNISSLHGGDIVGLDLRTDNSGTLVKHCTTKNVYAFGDDTTSVVNPPSTTYGFRAESNSGPVEFSRCVAKKITAPRSAFGFSAEESEGVAFSQCTVEDVSATSSKDLVASPKQAFGYDLESASDTLLTCVRAKNIRIEGEQNASESASVAAGIGIDSESQNTTIVCPNLKDIKGGAGQAFTIYNLGQNTVVETKKCKQICKPCK